MNTPIDLRVALRRNVELSTYCTMQVGGPAAYFAEPKTEGELLEALGFARSERLPHVILGKGSNIIFPDDGYPGVVISMLHYEDTRVEYDMDQNTVTASAGVHLYRFCLMCREAGLGGAEFLSSIPGTIGGAVFMNAGYSRFAGQRSEIGDLILSVRALDEFGNIQEIPANELEFTYRTSNLKQCIILSATLQLWRRPSEEIEKEIRLNFQYRNDVQDVKHPSSGSIFKNPEGDETAGQIIDRLGLKGTRVGDAMVSPKHGNYMINLGNARSQDIVDLIDLIKKTVLNAAQISLDPEVKIITRP